MFRDHLRMRPLKHVKTTVSTVAKKKKRANKAVEILGMYADGMRTNQIFWSDETWVDQDSCARYNPQNDRMYFPKDQKKDDNLDKLIKPIRQRAPGIMVHITVTSAGGGQVLKPFFVDPGETMTAKYYIRMLKTDTLRQIATIVPPGGKFYFQQDLASPHTAKITKEFLAENDVALAPWLPSGADCSPLDIYVNPELKKRLRGQDLSTTQKLMGATARHLDAMSKDAKFLKGLKKCCKGIKKWTKWVAYNEGRPVTHTLVNAEQQENKSAQK